jgi:hypothetical protein
MERQHQFNEGNRTLTYTFAPLLYMHNFLMAICVQEKLFM